MYSALYYANFVIELLATPKHNLIFIVEVSCDVILVFIGHPGALPLRAQQLPLELLLNVALINHVLMEHR